MKVSELIAALSEQNPDAEVLVQMRMDLDEDEIPIIAYTKIGGVLPGTCHRFQIQHMDWDMAVHRDGEGSHPVVTIEQLGFSAEVIKKLTDDFFKRRDQPQPGR